MPCLPHCNTGPFGEICKMLFNQYHLDNFVASLNEPYFWPGKAPAQWATDLALDGIPNAENLPQNALSREQLRTICLDANQDPLFGYVCTMAWGGQNAGPTGKRNARNAWESRQVIRNMLMALRAGQMDRNAAYRLFCENNIEGLGPSFFTKLLFFFSPTPDFYIMDQWTAKSVNLLTGKRIVKLYGATQRVSPHPSNTPDNYAVFCAVIDALGRYINLPGDKVEEKLFSKGRIRRGNGVGMWREYVINHWANQDYQAIPSNNLADQLEIYSAYRIE